jgi:hypothetical protein
MMAVESRGNGSNEERDEDKETKAPPAMGGTTIIYVLSQASPIVGPTAVDGLDLRACPHLVGKRS